MSEPDWAAYEAGLRNRIKDLEEVLKPFANFATVIDEAEKRWGGSPSPDEKAIHGELTVGTFRHARAVLEKKHVV